MPLEWGSKGINQENYKYITNVFSKLSKELDSTANLNVT